MFMQQTGYQSIFNYEKKSKNRDIKDRFINQEKNNINIRGEFYICCSEERFQERNREIVMEKIQEKLDKASIKPKERIIRRGKDRKIHSFTEVNDIVKKKWDMPIETVIPGENHKEC